MVLKKAGSNDAIIGLKAHSKLGLGVRLLEKRVTELESFRPSVLLNWRDADPLIQALNASVGDALTRTFGSGSDEYRRYSAAANISLPHYSFQMEIHEIVEELERSKKNSISLLQTAINSLKEQLEDIDEVVSGGTGTSLTDFGKSRKVFVVHGHDEGSREAVVRFLEKCDFEPIILHEQANQGQTIIEKFEANADVSFAVVLLTPDDSVKGLEDEVIKRARQNVILELGYFTGRLGRDRVCALKRGDVELPSDILGVVWTDFDAAGAWKQGLATELDAAGLNVDWNIVMRG